MGASENLDARDVRGNWLDSRLITTIIGGAIGSAATIFAAGIYFAEIRQGAKDGTEALQGMRENRAAITNATTTAQININNKLATEMQTLRRGLQISLGKIVSNHIAKLKDAQAETARAVAVQGEALSRSEAAARERMERMERTFRDWQIRRDGP